MPEEASRPGCGRGKAGGLASGEAYRNGPGGEERRKDKSWRQVGNPGDTAPAGVGQVWHSLSSHSCLQGPVTREAVEMCQELPVRSGIHAEGECPARRVGSGRDGEHRRPGALCRPGRPEAWLTRVAGPKPPEADLVPVPWEHASSQACLLWGASPAPTCANPKPAGLQTAPDGGPV